MKKAMYYTTLAMQICRQLNAFHSSVYNRYHQAQHTTHR